jgi:hypothetical protein
MSSIENVDLRKAIATPGFHSSWRGAPKDTIK